MKPYLSKLIKDVFHPECGERILVMTDMPHSEIRDNPQWIERREMASEWHTAFSSISKEGGFSVLPLVSFPAVKERNEDPYLQDGNPIKLADALSQSTLTVAFTENSISAFLLDWAKNHKDFRAASMPGVARRMEDTALRADYAEVARRCKMLGDCFDNVLAARIKFSTGHKLFMDLRFRKVYLEDGQLPRNKVNNKLINLPSGEVCIAPYEGERLNDPSGTKGEIPVSVDDETFVLKIMQNRIIEVVGNGIQANEWRKKFEIDEARRNIAELGLGCNPKAVVWGNVLEDEKAGFHWAYGRSSHFGGAIGPANFKSPQNVLHDDIIYAKGCPIQADSLVLEYSDHTEKEIVRNKEYTVFG